MGTIGFQPSLFDSSGTPVVWDDQLRTPVQDPSYGSKVYGGGDVVWGSEGLVYQVCVADGRVIAVGGSSAPPTQSSVPDAITNSSSDIQAGLPTASHDESGVPVNATNPSSPPPPVFVGTIFYAQVGRVIQKDSYSDGTAIF